MEKYISICPNCGRVYRHVVDKTQMCFERSCLTVETVFSGYTEPEWEALSETTKRETVENVKSTTPTQKTSTAVTDSNTRVTDSDTWISLLNTVANIDIFLGILGSIIGGAFLFDLSILLGLAVIALGTIFTLIIAASVKVFLGVAEDVHYLRKNQENNSKAKS